MTTGINEKIKRALFCCEDFIYEKINFQDYGIVPANEIQTNSQNLPCSNSHHAVHNRNLRVLLEEVKKSKIEIDGFCDIGSGKGKACLYAARKLKNTRVIGVEFSSELIRFAEKNARNLRCNQATFIHADAADFLLPDLRNLVFMFNPFGEEVFKRFIANNLDHFKNKGSLLAYSNDKLKNLLIEFGFATLFRDQNRQISLHVHKDCT
jgi:SAM-dependent methyltransferase